VHNFRTRWRLATYDPQRSIDLDCTGVDPGPPRLSRGGYLLLQLIWRPEIVIVAKRNPPSDGRCYAAVSCRTHTQRRGVPDQAHAGVRTCRYYIGSRVVVGAVIDHDHLEVHFLLLTDAAQR
jgi:hypothetical protein